MMSCCCPVCYVLLPGWPNKLAKALDLSLFSGQGERLNARKINKAKQSENRILFIFNMTSDFGKIELTQKRRIPGIQEITLKSVTVEECSLLMHSFFSKSAHSYHFFRKPTDLMHTTFTKLP